MIEEPLRPAIRLRYWLGRGAFQAERLKLVIAVALTLPASRIFACVDRIRTRHCPDALDLSRLPTASVALAPSVWAFAFAICFAFFNSDAVVALAIALEPRAVCSMARNSLVRVDLAYGHWYQCRKASLKARRMRFRAAGWSDLGARLAVRGLWVLAVTLIIAIAVAPSGLIPETALSVIGLSALGAVLVGAMLCVGAAAVGLTVDALGTGSATRYVIGWDELAALRPLLETRTGQAIVGLLRVARAAVVADATAH